MSDLSKVTFYVVDASAGRRYVISVTPEEYESLTLFKIKRTVVKVSRSMASASAVQPPSSAVTTKSELTKDNFTFMLHDKTILGDEKVLAADLNLNAGSVLAIKRHVEPEIVFVPPASFNRQSPPCEQQAVPAAIASFSEPQHDVCAANVPTVQAPDTNASQGVPASASCQALEGPSDPREQVKCEEKVVNLSAASGKPPIRWTTPTDESIDFYFPEHDDEERFDDECGGVGEEEVMAESRGSNAVEKHGALPTVDDAAVDTPAEDVAHVTGEDETGVERQKNASSALKQQEEQQEHRGAEGETSAKGSPQLAIKEKSVSFSDTVRQEDRSVSAGESQSAPEKGTRRSSISSSSQQQQPEKQPRERSRSRSKGRHSKSTVTSAAQEGPTPERERELQEVITTLCTDVSQLLALHTTSASRVQALQQALTSAHAQLSHLQETQSQTKAQLEAYENIVLPRVNANASHLLQDSQDRELTPGDLRSAIQSIAYEHRSEALRQENKVLAAQAQRERKQRIALVSAAEDLKGRLRVIARVRSLTTTSTHAAAPCASASGVTEEEATSPTSPFGIGEHMLLYANDRDHSITLVHPATTTAGSTSFLFPVASTSASLVGKVSQHNLYRVMYPSAKCNVVIDSLEGEEEKEEEQEVERSRNMERFELPQMDAYQNSQEQLYSTEVRPLLQQALDGSNALLIAYGQSGSGKTYSLFGKPEIATASTAAAARGGNTLGSNSEGAGEEEGDNAPLDPDAGMLQRALVDLFAQLEEAASAEQLLHMCMSSETGNELATLRLPATFEVQCSMVELYNDKLRDLLGPLQEVPIVREFNAGRRNVAISVSSTGGRTGGGGEVPALLPATTPAVPFSSASPSPRVTLKKGSRPDVVGIMYVSPSCDLKITSQGVEVVGLSRHTVCTAVDAWRLVRAGLARREQQTTANNTSSSRSHLVVTLYVTQRRCARSGAVSTSLGGADAGGGRRRDRGKATWVNSTVAGKLVFADLAAAERVGKSQCTGERLKEAQFVNKSLSALADVVAALSPPPLPTPSSPSTTAAGTTVPIAKHVPYRSNKLTSLLQGTLNGNGSVCVVLACISVCDALTLATEAAMREEQQGKGAAGHKSQTQQWYGVGLKGKATASKGVLSSLAGQQQSPQYWAALLGQWLRKAGVKALAQETEEKGRCFIVSAEAASTLTFAARVSVTSTASEVMPRLRALCNAAQ